MNINAISISQFRQHRIHESEQGQTLILGDDILITQNIAYRELFKYPCRLDAFMMLVCLKGEIRGSINLCEYTTSSNDIVVCLPDDIIHIDSGNEFELYAVIISASFLREAHIDINKSLPIYLNLKQNHLYRLNDDEMLTLQYYHILSSKVLKSTDNPHKREIIQGLLSSLTYSVIALINERNADSSDVDIKLNKRSEMLFDNFMSLLNEHHTKEHRVKFYASKLNLSANYLSGIIKEVGGKSAAQWIDEYVLIEAQTLLKFSNMTIQEVAYHLNFATQSSFGKYFKQQTGMSPKKFIAQ